jgi:putative ABC transport system permease protein
MAPLADRLPPSLRGLLRQKRFATLGILSLGIAIALNTTMYSVTDALLFPKVAIREPENLYRMPFYGDYRQRLTQQQREDALKGLTWVEASAHRRANFGATNLAESGSQSRTARVLNVSTNYFDLLGVKALAGRLFTSADNGSTAQPVVVSERFFRQMFPGRDMNDTVSFTLDAEPRTVVGVLAYESDFPGEMTDVWQIPAVAQNQVWSYVFNIYRLKPGTSIGAAYTELGAAAAVLERLAGDGPKNARFDLERIMRDGPMRFQGFHIAVIGAVGFVLLVACFNLANLQLARGLSRTKEMATRAAVGATRGQLIWLLVSESAWIAAAGFLVGVLLTFWGIDFVKSQLPPALETFLIRPQVNWRLFAFAAATGGLALAIVGLIPAIRVSRVDVNELIKSGAGTGATRKTRWQAGGLVVLQVGLALALMVGATLLIRSAISLYQLDINPVLERVATARLGVSQTRPGDARDLRYVSRQVVSRALSIPGVTEAATIRGTQPERKVVSVSVEGALPREVPTGLWGYSLVSDGYLRVYGMTVLKGRGFTPGETGRSVVMDARTAKFLWPNSDPIGQQLKFGSDSRRDQGWFTVVGIVKPENTWSSFRSANQSERVEPALNLVLALNAADTASLPTGVTGTGAARERFLQLSVSSQGATQRLPMLLRRTLTDPGSGFRVQFAERLASALQLDQARELQNFVAGMFTTFALIALGLSALGVYAVVSHTVTERTREFGVRVALGASERAIRQSVMFHGNVMALCGIAIGELVAFGTVGFLGRFMRATGPSDILAMFFVAAGTLFATTLLASYLPARRAMRINPVEALRAE